MKGIKFKYKNMNKPYSYFSIIGIILSVFLFTSLDKGLISPSLGYFIVSIISSYLLFKSIKKASKLIEEIIFDSQSIEFVFLNKMKNRYNTKIENILVIIKDDSFEFKELSSGFKIGSVLKSSLLNDGQLSELLGKIDNVKNS